MKNFEKLPIPSANIAGIDLLFGLYQGRLTLYPSCDVPRDTLIDLQEACLDPYRYGLEDSKDEVIGASLGAMQWLAVDLSKRLKKAENNIELLLDFIESKAVSDEQVKILESLLTAMLHGKSK